MLRPSAIGRKDSQVRPEETLMVKDSDSGNGHSGAAATSAALRPDAAPSRSQTALRVAVHALVLGAVVAFLAYYCLWMPLWGRTAAAFKLAHVRSVAPGLLEIRSPEVSGVFQAAAPLSIGTRLSKGQILGEIESPELLAQIEQKTQQVRMLQARHQQLEMQRSLHAGDWQYEQAAEELLLRVASISQELARLRSLKEQLVIRAPADGYVQAALPLSQDVKPNQGLLKLYPEGAPLLLEITGPAEAIDALRRREQVVMAFAADGQNLTVAGRPISDSYRPFVKIMPGGRDEEWALLQCTPESLPQALHRPGLLGRLR